VRVQILFFGLVKDVVGRSQESLEVAEGSSLESVFDNFAERYPKLKELRKSLVLARNQQFSSGAETLGDGDEIAFLPPVSGGAGSWTHEIEDAESGNFFALTRDPIDARALAGRILRGEDGAVVSFDGVVRNNTKGRATKFLDYEGYESMAVQVMARIGRDLAGEYAIGRVAMVHRLGRLEIGEASVVIVVTAPHRRPAFEAALEGINRLKRLTPIWKKEHFADGEVWVEGEWDEAVLGR
jgi:MoaE-MoaD fusion protein